MLWRTAFLSLLLLNHHHSWFTSAKSDRGNGGDGDGKTIQLRNGVQIPTVSLGMGLWCNTPHCPAPAKPCADCYNDSAAMADVLLAAGQGT